MDDLVTRTAEASDTNGGQHPSLQNRWRVKDCRQPLLGQERSARRYPKLRIYVRESMSSRCKYSPPLLMAINWGLWRRGRSVCGFPVLDPRHSRVVKVSNIVVEWLDATYTAFKVPIGVAVYQNSTQHGLLTVCDIIAGRYPSAPDAFSSNLTFHLCSRCGHGTFLLACVHGRNHLAGSGVDQVSHSSCGLQEERRPDHTRWQDHRC